MTRDEMHSWFDILQDKNNAPYFTDPEKDNFLNRAQIAIVNQFVFTEFFPSTAMGERGPQTLSSLESTISGSEVLKPLIIEDLAVTTDAADFDKIVDSDINTAIQTRTGAASENYMHVLSLETTGSTFTSGRIVRYVRHNDYLRIKKNVFKKPTDDDPIFRVVDGGVVVEGTTTLTGTEGFKVTVLKSPLEISATQDCELPDFIHDLVVAKALEFAGIATRDEVLTMVNAGGK